MDLRAYYRKMRETEGRLAGDFVIVKSLATPDGGVAGRLTEVSRAVAAKMIVDGMAEPAPAEEAEQLRQNRLEEKKREDQRRASARIQFTVVSESDMRALQRAGRAEPEE